MVTFLNLCKPADLDIKNIRSRNVIFFLKKKSVNQELQGFDPDPLINRKRKYGIYSQTLQCIKKKPTHIILIISVNYTSKLSKSYTSIYSVHLNLQQYLKDSCTISNPS